jgi:hypothetical protein
VGADAQLALTLKSKKEAHLTAQVAGVPLMLAVTQTDLRASAEEYIAEIKAGRSRRTFLCYDLALRLFQDYSEVKHLEDVTRKDILGFVAHLRSLGKGSRTVPNNIRDLKIFFAHYKIQWPMMKTDRLSYVEPVVRAYNKAEIQSLLAAADDEEQDLFYFFLGSGAIVPARTQPHRVWRLTSKSSITSTVDK